MARHFFPPALGPAGPCGLARDDNQRGGAVGASGLCGARCSFGRQSRRCAGWGCGFARVFQSMGPGWPLNDRQRWWDACAGRRHQSVIWSVWHFSGTRRPARRNSQWSDWAVLGACRCTRPGRGSPRRGLLARSRHESRLQKKKSSAGGPCGRPRRGDDRGKMQDDAKPGTQSQGSGDLALLSAAKDPAPCRHCTGVDLHKNFFFCFFLTNLNGPFSRMADGSATIQVRFRGAMDGLP